MQGRVQYTRHAVKKIGIGFTLLFFYSLTWCTPIGAQQVIIATGDPEGVYHPMGKTLCRLLQDQAKKSHQTIKCSVRPTQGSIENLTLLQSTPNLVAFTQSNWQYHAYQGLRYFAAKGGNKDMRALVVLHDEPLTIVTRKEAKVQQFKDLVGKRIIVGESGSGDRGMLEILMRYHGMTMSDFSQVTRMNFHQQVDALCSGKADAMIHTIAHPNPLLAGALTRCHLQFVPLKQTLIEKVNKKYPYFFKSEIPAGLYEGVSSPTPTLSVKATLVTTKALPNKTAYLLVQSIDENLVQLQNAHPALISLNRKNFFDGNTAPLHEGVVEYGTSTSALRF